VHFARVASLALLVGALEPATARAADDDPQALIRQGNALRARGQTASALGLFKRAHDIARSPRTAAQLGLCEFALGSYLDAMTHLSEALASHDSWIDENRALLEKTANNLKKHLGEIDVTGGPAGAAIALDGKPVGTLPAATAWALPGRVSLTVKAPGYIEETRALEIASGQRREERFDLRTSSKSATANHPLPERDRAAAMTSPPATPTSPEPRGPLIATSAESTRDPATNVDARPIYGQWWFWTIIGAVALTGAATALIITHPWRSSPTCDVSPCTIW
jgi:hypothetical protein